MMFKEIGILLDRQFNIWLNIQRSKYLYIQIQVGNYLDRNQIDRQIEIRQIDRQKLYRQVARQMARQVDIQIDRQEGRQMIRWIDDQMDR